MFKAGQLMKPNNMLSIYVKFLLSYISMSIYISYKIMYNKIKMLLQMILQTYILARNRLFLTFFDYP